MNTQDIANEILTQVTQVMPYIHKSSINGNYTLHTCNLVQSDNLLELNDTKENYTILSQDRQANRLVRITSAKSEQNVTSISVDIGKELLYPCKKNTVDITDTIFERADDLSTYTYYTTYMVTPDMLETYSRDEIIEIYVKGIVDLLQKVELMHTQNVLTNLENTQLENKAFFDKRDKAFSKMLGREDVQRVTKNDLISKLSSTDLTQDTIQQIMNMI